MRRSPTESEGNALLSSVEPSPGFSLGIPGLALLLLVMPLRSLPAQAIGQGVELERAGQYDRAASLYFATLRADPTNLGALLGLERVLPPLNRLEELLPVARRAAAALTESPAQLPNAASDLAEAPEAQRERVASVLTGGDPPPLPLARRLAGEVLLAWGQPQRAWDVFAPSVATPSADAAYALRRFADLAAASNTPTARRVRALALARFAER